MKKDKDLLKKGLEKPENDFTSKVMQQINAEDVALRQVLARHGKLETSDDFTTQLMAQLEGKKQSIPYQPVISKYVWGVLAAVFAGIILLTLSLNQPGVSKVTIGDDIQQLTTSFVSIFTDRGMFMYSIIGILLLSIALLIEQRHSVEK